VRIRLRNASQVIAILLRLRGMLPAQGGLHRVEVRTRVAGVVADQETGAIRWFGLREAARSRLTGHPERAEVALGLRAGAPIALLDLEMLAAHRARDIALLGLDAALDDLAVHHRRLRECRLRAVQREAGDRRPRVRFPADGERFPRREEVDVDLLAPDGDGW